MACPVCLIRDHAGAGASVLLPQARRFLSDHAITPVSAVGSAGAATDLTQSQNRERGVLASALAAEIYGLNILAKYRRSRP